MNLLRSILLMVLAGAIGVARRLPIRRGALLRPAIAEAPGKRGRSYLKRWVVQMVVFLSVLAVGGFLVVATGIIPIKASSGHWGITAWFLNFSMERSFSFHSMGTKVPPLDNPDMVLRGAGHYETGCRPCHGSPELPQPRIAQAMTPPPPYLPPQIEKWEPAELFNVVKHGVKFTGMPAWPSQVRDDEVWSMVAFLLLLPDLDGQEYRNLVSGEGEANTGDAPMSDLLGQVDVPQTVTASCARCHGIDGSGRGEAAFPRLDGQKPTYLYASLQAYARGDRHSGIMEPIAAGLDEDQMRDLARYYGGLTVASVRQRPVNRQAIERGRNIATGGRPDRRIPACFQCHGPAPTRRNPIYPILAGQYAEYLILQLELFQKGYRGGTAYAHLMHPTADRLTPEEMRDVALFYESLQVGDDLAED